MHRSIHFVTAMSLLALAACSSEADPDTTDEDVTVTEEALDSMDASEVETEVLSGATAEVNPSATPEEAATAAAAAAKTAFAPSGCATAEVNGATVTYTLTGCTGRFGHADIDGELQVTFSAAPNGKHVAASGSIKAANGASLTVDTEAEYTKNGDVSSLEVETSSEGTGPRGFSIGRTGAYTVTWSAADKCVTLDGAWSTGTAARMWSTQVTGYERCAGQCPAAGGEIVHKGGVSNVTLTITYDGSSKAAWSTSRGRSGSVALPCGS